MVQTAPQEQLRKRGQPLEACIPKLCELFEKADKVIAHNVKFDIHVSSES